MTNIDNNIKVKTTGKIIGIKEEVKEQGKNGIDEETKEQEDEKIIEEVKALEENYESETEIKDAETNIDVKINNTTWTNKQQNDITFDVYINANTVKNNMLKNPSVRIELPNQVEKVVLGESSIVYANGLELEQPYLETSENGNIVIVANIKGDQTSYEENALGLVTDVKLSATIILKKDIEASEENINVTCTNEFTLNKTVDSTNKVVGIEIQSYQEEQKPNTEVISDFYATTPIAINEDTSGLQVEVVPVKGNTNLSEGDPVYEGEFIKYNIKVSNTSEKDINNIKIVATIPDGVVYGELEADYYTSVGKYEYNFNKELKEKIIDIKTLKAGESTSEFYEVQANDLSGEDEKQIKSIIKAYVGQTEATSYEINNIIKPSQAKVFLGAFLGVEKNAWNYTLLVSSDKTEEVEAKLEVPKEFNLDYILIDPGYEGGGSKLKLDEIAHVNGNVISIKIQTNKKYLIAGYMKRTELETENEGSELELTAVAKVQIGDEIYSSNENRILYGYDSISILMTSENEGEEVKYGEEINYEIVVTNTGKCNLENELNSCITANIVDFLPEDVEPVKITYNNYVEEIANEVKDADGQTESFESTGIYKEEEKVIENICDLTDEDGNRLPNVDLNLTIPYGKSVKIKIETTAGLVFEKTKTENSATVSGILEEDNIKSKISNTITHTILPFDYIEPTDSEDPNDSTDPDDSSNQTNPDDPTNQDNPSQQDTYSISGVAWLDENQDGQRQESEKLLDNITVLLVDSKNSSTVKARTTTNTSGVYNFSELEKGNYIVIFQYNTDEYFLTEYQKNGISNEANSDAISQTITIQGKEQKVGITDILNLDASLKNIDIGIVKNKICDLKLDKYISKVSVRTKSGTKQTSYDNSKLAKVEIKAKEIEGATVVVEYKLVVTNEGELATNVNKVVDYLPNGLTFSSELNKNWITLTNGELVNTSLAARNIKPGESVEIPLILTKQMTSNTTGTFTNSAEIGEISNQQGIKDTDSTPGNKQEDDYSKADLIISVSTGAVVYISIGILLIIVVGGIVFVSYKYGILKIGKISLFVIALMATLVAGSNDAIGLEDMVENEAPLEAKFTWSEDDHGYSNEYGSRYFDGDDKTGDALCIQPGVDVADANSTYKFNGYGGSASYASNSGMSSAIKDMDFNLQKDHADENINISENGNNIKLGTFYFTYTETKVKINVYNYNKKTIQSFTVISDSLTDDGNGEYQITETGAKRVINFDIQISKEDYEKGIAYIELVAESEEISQSSENIYRQAEYCYSETTQDVITFRKFKASSSTSENKITKKEKIQWVISTGNLRVRKIDKDSKKGLKGVKIKITKPDGTSEDYITGDDGYTDVIKNLPIGSNYKIQEIEIPNTNECYGYTKKVEKNVTVKGGTTVTCELENEKQTGNLEIVKKDSNSGKGINGIGFKLKNSSGQYIIAVDNKDESKEQKVTGEITITNLKTTNNENEATEFVTGKVNNQDGIIGIKNLLVGEYTVIETSVGNNFGYDPNIDGNFITWDKGTVTSDKRGTKIKIERQNSTSGQYNNKLGVSNAKKYIKLSGYVWEDIVSTKQSTKNYLYNVNTDDNADKLLSNVEVTLKDKNGKILAGPRTTNSDGKYKFGDYQANPKETKIEISDLDGAYVEFEYNGMCYQSVPLDERIKNNEYYETKGSKATEETRQEFNNNFAWITNNKANSLDNKTHLTLSYDKGENTSTLTYGNKSNYKYGYNGQAYPISGVDEQYKITSSTNSVLTGESSLNNKAQAVLKNGGDEIENINLGMYQREQPDISLVKDLQNIKLTINEYSNVYNYAQRFQHENDLKPTEEDLNVGVKYKNEYTGSYSRALYGADIKYTNEDKSKELKAYLTYKIRLINESSNLTVQVNSIVDYFDSNYTIKKVGTGLDENGEITGYLYYKEEESNNAGYKKTNIVINNNEEKIAKQKYKDIYVQFELNIESIIDILNDKEKLDNVAEITSYAVFDKNESRYAGIDKDSNPGNATPGDTKTYEDDTDAAPPVQLEEGDNTRSIEGTVFLDSSTGGIGVERKGNGQYDFSKDTTIEGVTVGLYKISDFDGDTTFGNDIKLKEGATPIGTTTYNNGTNGTGTDGYFKITEFHPDKYIVVYTWGDKSYAEIDGKLQAIDVDSYKATIYNEKERANNENWFNIYPEKRFSDAIDNYTIRQEIDKDNNSTAIDKPDRPTKMESRTPVMDCKIENVDTTTASAGNQYEYLIKYVDFGIVERARQVINIDKEVSNVKITLANGEVIVDASLEDIKDGKIEGVIYTGGEGYEPKNGLIYVSIDSELLQGATTNITYTVKVKNESEKDYDSKEYYQYGTPTGNVIKIQPIGVYDYLDNELKLNRNDATTSSWEVIEKEDYSEGGYVSNPTIIEDWLKEEYSKDITDTGDIVETTTYEQYQEQYQKIVENWTMEKIKETRTKRLADRTILRNDKLIENIEPGDEGNVATLNVSKVLSSTEDIELDNDAEITEVKRDEDVKTGRKVDVKSSKLYDRGETVTITTPTGDNKEYTPIIIMGISLLVTLTAGIVFIKKKVLS